MEQFASILHTLLADATERVNDCDEKMRPSFCQEPELHLIDVMQEFIAEWQGHRP